MTIYYRTKAIGDPKNSGMITLSAAMRRNFDNATYGYCLGTVADKGVAYATSSDEELVPVTIETLAQMADRIDYLRQIPAVYDFSAKLGDVSAALRAFKMPVAAPVVTTPAPAPTTFVPNMNIPVVPTPTGALPVKVTLAAFNNGKPANGATWFGASLGDGKYDGNGWPKGSDMDAMIALGVKTVRLPIRMRYCFLSSGKINDWVVKTIVNTYKKLAAAGVAIVLDAHEYMLFNDPLIANFWASFAPVVEKAIGGPSPLFGIELSNEPGKGSEDLTKWTEPLRSTIKAIRASGYQGYIFAGAGDWNNMTFLPKAFAEIERTGGVVAMDPYNRTIYTGHDYWNKSSDPAKTRNDQGAAVDGKIDIAKRYDPALVAARRIGAKVCISEIGGGISPEGPLLAYQGIGKDGLALQNEFFAWAKANEDALIGTWFWMGGKTDLGYRHKIETGNPHTKSLQKFWN